MGWQEDRDPWPGDAPRPGDGLPDLLAGFEHGGAWDAAAPSAGLTAALEAASGPLGRYDGADTGALVGIVRQWAAIESWAASGMFAALRAMMREDGEGRPLLRRRSDLPDGWDDSLNYEISGALAMGPVSAGNLASLAWTLGTRLPGIGRLLADGTLTKPKARLIAQTFEPLSEDEAARAEALILSELAGKTYFQVERLAWRAALAVAPDVAERRRSAAERERARVTVFREESGAVGLSGRDLPAAQALSGHASVLARAGQYEASGAFPGQAASALQALAYLHLLNGVTAQDAIAFARAATAEPPDGTKQDDGDEDGKDSRGPADRGTGTGTGNHGDDDGDDENHRDDDDHGDGQGPRGNGPDGNGPDGNGPDGSGGDTGGGSGPGGDRSPGGAGGQLALPEVTAPLATLQGRAERPGDSRLLGPLDPALARDLAAAAARSPYSRWEVTIVDDRGYATGHGIARPGRGRRHQPQPRPPGPASSALPARINITVTEALLHQLAAQAAQPRPGAPPGDWELAPRTGKNGNSRWVLTLPGGRKLALRFDDVPTHACDHRYQTSAYQPGDRLRRLVQVRDHECTFPPCTRPAHASDFEHAIPYDKGGRTDACNAGARSRRCHQVKQSPGWTVTQPKPGWHAWTTPTGRTYVQEPWRYLALAAHARLGLGGDRLAGLARRRVGPAAGGGRARLGGGLDQRGEQAKVVAFLGVPVDADAEPVPGDLESLGDLAVGRPGGHGQAVAQRVRGLVVRGRDHDPGAEQAAEDAVGGQGHVVRRVARPGRAVAGEVLGQRAAAGHGQHVQSPADREERHVAVEGGAHEGQLEPVPAVLGLVGLVLPLLVVERRVDVPAAGEDQAVDALDEGGHRVGRNGRKHQGRSPGPGDRAGIADGRDHGFPDPVPPPSGVQLAGDSDDRAAH